GSDASVAVRTRARVLQRLRAPQRGGERSHLGLIGREGRGLLDAQFLGILGYAVFPSRLPLFCCESRWHTDGQRSFRSVLVMAVSRTIASDDGPLSRGPSCRCVYSRIFCWRQSKGGASSG